MDTWFWIQARLVTCTREQCCENPESLRSVNLLLEISLVLCDVKVRLIQRYRLDQIRLVLEDFSQFRR